MTRSILLSRTRRRHACLGAGLAIAMLTTASTAAAQSTVTYQYDALGRVVSATYSNGASVTYSYDAAGNRTTVTSTGAHVIVVPLLGGLVIPIR